MVVTSDIGDGKIYTFFDDHFITTDIRKEYLILVIEIAGALIFSLDRVHQDLAGLFSKGKEAQLGVIENSLDEMELDQHFLLKQLGAVKKDLVILQIIDVLQLKGGHTRLPDDLPGSSAERNILGCDDRIGQIRRNMFM